MDFTAADEEDIALDSLYPFPQVVGIYSQCNNFLDLSPPLPFWKKIGNHLLFLEVGEKMRFFLFLNKSIHEFFRM